MAEAKVKQEVNFDVAIQLAKEEFTMRAKWVDNAGCIFIDQDGTFGRYDGHVCHANLRNGKGSKFIINGLMIGTSYGSNPGRILAPEIELWFVDYILNRSPYSAIFVEKDAEKALKERMVVVSGDHPGNLIGAGLVALRRLWEYVFVTQAAYELAKAGVNEDLAFFLGHLMQTKNNSGPADSASWTACTSGHCSLNPNYWDFKALKNFLEHNIQSPQQNYSKGGNYTGYDAMYGGDYGGTLLEYIRTNFPVHLYKDKPAPVAAVGTNPFQVAKKVLEKPAKDAGVAKEKVTNYAKAIEVMAEWAKTHLMEKIYA